MPVLNAHQSFVLIVDMQTGLLPAIADHQALVERAEAWAEIQGIDMTELWWRHHRALRANGRTAAAQRALAAAAGLPLLFG